MSRDGGKLNGLDLFSGIGGISLALEPWVRTVAYCEADRYAQSVLLSRMASGQIELAPIWDDVRTLDGRSLTCSIDVIFGGFPCQDISVAGNGVGLEGERSGLFFEIVRLVGELRPRFIFLENVPAITVRGLDRVLLELTKIGYDCRWTIVSAAEVGAPHLRERWFLLAYANGERGGDESDGIGRRRDSTKPWLHSKAQSLEHAQHRGNGRREQFAQGKEGAGDVADPVDAGCNELRRPVPGREFLSAFERGSKTLVNADGAGLGFAQESNARGGIGGEGKRTYTAAAGASWWDVEPPVGRVAHGIPMRVDRLRGLGNAVVPLQAQTAFKRLLGIEG